MRKQNLSIQQAILSFLLDCKGKSVPIETLCDYENTFVDFFEGLGTETIEDIAKDSKFANIAAMSLEDVEAYIVTVEQRNACRGT